MIDYKLMVMVTSPLMITLMAVVGWLMYKITKDSKEYYRVKGELETKSRLYRSSYRDNRELMRKNQELENKLEANIKVGSIFYPPNNDRWVYDFGGTTQKIVSINHEDLLFSSKDVNSGKIWINKFDQAKEFMWGHNSNNMKHKFLS